MPRTKVIDPPKSSSVRAKDVREVLLAHDFLFVCDPEQSFKCTFLTAAKETRNLLGVPTAKLSLSGDSFYMAGRNAHSGHNVEVFVPAKGMVGQKALHNLQAKTGITFPTVN